MLPALRDGELRFVRRDPLALRRLRRGDVVVLRHPWDPQLKLIKRIAAIPGDRVDAQGRRVVEPRDPGAVDWVLDADQYVVLSDNGAGGLDDSRRFGPVRRRLIEGRLTGRR